MDNDALGICPKPYLQGGRVTISEQTATELIGATDRLSRTLERLMSNSSSDDPLRTISALTRALNDHTEAIRMHTRLLEAHTNEMSLHGGALNRASMR